MKQHYPDLLALTPAPPLWYDENGAPRFAPFHPSLAAEFYARESALLRIECQACGREFDVCVSCPTERRMHQTLVDAVLRDAIHYGDPPNVECCAAGPSMNSVPKRVLQFWRRERSQWVRVPELEREIKCSWGEE